MYSSNPKGLVPTITSKPTQILNHTGGSNQSRQSDILPIAPPNTPTFIIWITDRYVYTQHQWSGWACAEFIDVARRGGATKRQQSFCIHPDKDKCISMCRIKRWITPKHLTEFIILSFICNFLRVLSLILARNTEFDARIKWVLPQRSPFQGEIVGKSNQSGDFQYEIVLTLNPVRWLLER